MYSLTTKCETGRFGIKQRVEQILYKTNKNTHLKRRQNMKKKILGIIIAGLALGSFTSSSYALPEHTRSEYKSNVALGDVVGDYNIDKVYIGRNGQYQDMLGFTRDKYGVVIEENLGNGSFKRYALDIIEVYQDDPNMQVQVIDYNGDKLNDIIARAGKTIIFLKNKGNLQFERKDVIIKK